MALSPGVGSLRWACTFHIFCVDFVSDANPFFSGIWALESETGEVYMHGTVSLHGPKQRSKIDLQCQNENVYPFLQSGFRDLHPV